MDLRPADPEAIRTKMINGLNNKNPRSSLAYCLQQKKTLRFGSRSDPFQPAEDQYQVSARMLEILYELKWTYAIQTRFPSRMFRHIRLLLSSKKLFTFIPVLSPGLDKDWEILERGRTDPPITRLRIARSLMKEGINVGFNGEPFIPGYHTVKDFEQTILLLKQYKIPSYNTYNFHFNPYVAKRLHAIGVDIERIWYYNQDKRWRKILKKLLYIAKKHEIRLGCPDFVNSGWGHIEKANTCCGVNVPNRTTFNTHIFKQMLQKGKSTEEILNVSYDGIGDINLGKEILTKKKSKDFYTINDIIN